MSQVTSAPDKSTTSEAAVLTALANLAPGGAGTAIQKTTTSTFNNISVSSSSGSTPGGAISQLQYNVDGVSLGGITGVTTNGTFLGFATALPTHSVTFSSASTGIALYNTSDQTTNYERAIINWTSNALQIQTGIGGTGTARGINIFAGPSNRIQVRPNLDTFGTVNIDNTLSGSANMHQFHVAGTFTASNNTSVGISIVPTITQTSTAGYTGLLVQPTETGTGSGTKLLASFGTNASPALFTISNAGHVTVEAVTSTGATGTGKFVFDTSPTIALASASTAVTQAAGDNSTAVATTAFVQSTVSTFDAKPDVDYASTSALPSNTYSNGASGVGATLTGTANGPLIIDSVTILIGQVGRRVLVAGEAAPANNGWYTITQQGVVAVSPYILTRATESDQAAEIGPGYLTSVIAPNTVTPGTANNGKVFISVAADPFTVGTTSVTFSQVGSTYSSGTGISLSGTTFSLSANAKISQITGVFDGGGSAIANGSTVYIPCAYAGSITAYTILADTGTCTIKTWKKATGTAIPTVSDSISTSGVALSSGTAVRSSTVSDFTSTTVSANDILAFNITAISGCTKLVFMLEITLTS